MQAVPPFSLPEPGATDKQSLRIGLSRRGYRASVRATGALNIRSDCDGDLRLNFRFAPKATEMRNDAKGQ